MKRFFPLLVHFLSVLCRSCAGARNSQDGGRKRGGPGKLREAPRFCVYPRAQMPPPPHTLYLDVFIFLTCYALPPPSFCRLLPPCPSFPLGRQPCALEALRDETTDWSCSRGRGGLSRRRGRRGRLQKKLGWRCSQDTSQQPNWMW